MSDILFRVEAPHFVAGVIASKDGKIIKAAPILKWSVGKRIDQFRGYCARKNWRVEQL